MKYRKIPVVIEALVWTGENLAEVEEFTGTKIPLAGQDPRHTRRFPIHTLEGVMFAGIGDFIIKGVKGEFYPCKPDIFALTYEAVE